MHTQSNDYKMKTRKRIFWLVAAIIIAAYIILINILISAALIPSFMDRLEAADRITERSYNEQVQSDELDQKVEETIDETVEWYKTVPLDFLEETSADGYHLKAIEFYPGIEDGTGNIIRTGEDTHIWVLLLHGYTGQKEEMYPLARWYQQQDFHVIVPDMRCQGESEGDFIGMGYTDSEDNMLWINEILRQDPNARIVLHGQSMGAACALMMSGREDLPENVMAVISDSAYTDAYSMFCDRFQAWFHLPPALVVPAANLFLQMRGGYDLHDASALAAVEHSTVTTLFIHGEEDKMIPPAMTQELYDAASCEKALLIVPGAGHVQAADVAPEEYFDMIGKVLSSTRVNQGE